MKLFHLVVSSSVSLFVYLVLNAIWGISGIQDFQDLLEYRAKLNSSIMQLRERQDAIACDLDRLRNDPSRLREEAYRVGMVGPGEIRVNVPMTPPPVGLPPAVGIVNKPESHAVAKPVITGLAISLGIILLLVLTMHDFESGLHNRNQHRRRTTVHQGMRVQTASRE